MKITVTIRKTGGSAYIVVPKEFLRENHLKIEDEAIFDLNLLQIISSDINVREFRCRGCEHCFEYDINSIEPIYCTICGLEGEDLFEEIKEEEIENEPSESQIS